MLNWQVGAVKITCVLEMLFPSPTILRASSCGTRRRGAQGQPLAYRTRQRGWFAQRVGPGLLVESTGLADGRHLHRQRQAAHWWRNPLADARSCNTWRMRAGAATVSTPCSAPTCTWTMWAGHHVWTEVGPDLPQGPLPISKREFGHWSSEGDEGHLMARRGGHLRRWIRQQTSDPRCSLMVRLIASLLQCSNSRC